MFSQETLRHAQGASCSMLSAAQKTLLPRTPLIVKISARPPQHFFFTGIHSTSLLCSSSSLSCPRSSSSSWFHSGLPAASIKERIRPNSCTKSSMWRQQWHLLTTSILHTMRAVGSGPPIEEHRRWFASPTVLCYARGVPRRRRASPRAGVKRKDVGDALLQDEDLFPDDLPRNRKEDEEEEDLKNLDDVIMEEEDVEGEDGEENESTGQRRTILGKKDGRYGKQGHVVIKKSDLDFFDSVRLEVPEALEQKLHTEDHISEAVTRTFITHQKIRLYACSRRYEVEREIVECVERLKDEPLGMCFYIRVVSLSDPTPEILTKCQVKPFVPFDEQKHGPAWEFGARVWRRVHHLPFFLYRHPEPTPSRLTPAQRQAVDRIKQLLHLHFSTCVIEPIDGELSCDISMYAKYSVLSEKAAIFVRQFKKDLDDMLEEKYIKDFENYGVCMNPTPDQVQPLTPEAVALRMAAFFKSIIFSVGDLGGVDPTKDLRVVIGIARTAVQAKIACDTEVAVVLGDKIGLASKEKGTINNTQLVRVRSFHKHFQRLEDEKNYMGTFPLDQIPVVNPQFAKFMKDVYQIEKASQILEKSNELYFSLCRTTFEYCVRLAYGRMQFPHEVHTPLLSKNARHIDEKLLEECAKNSISILNDNRTQLLVDMPRALYTTGKIQTGFLLQGQKSYGRLISNEKYVQAAEEAAYLPISHLYDHHCSTAALHIEDRRSFRRIAWESVSFPRTTNPHMLIKIVRQIAEKMALQRKQTVFDGQDEAYCFYVKLSQLESYNLLPRALEEGINAVMQAMKEGMDKRKLFRNSIRRITINKCLYKRSSHRNAPSKKGLDRKESPTPNDKKKKCKSTTHRGNKKKLGKR